MSYEIIKHNFDRGLWSIPMVKMAVAKGIITRDEYKNITGEPYL